MATTETRGRAAGSRIELSLDALSEEGVASDGPVLSTQPRRMHPKSPTMSDVRDGDLQKSIPVLRERLIKDEEIARLISKPERDLSSVALVRFLRASNGNVDAAREQAKAIFLWRDKHKVDLIITRDYEFLAQDRWGMAYWHGKDLWGRPILVIRGSRHDPTLFKAETTIRYLLWKLEKKLAEEGVDAVDVLFDVNSMSRHNMDLKIFRSLVPLLLKFYPERLGFFVVYPTTQIFWFFWKIAAKKLDERTESKFVFIREEKRESKFCKLIAPDQLQERFGGTDKTEYGVDGLALLPISVQQEHLDIVSPSSASVASGQSCPETTQPNFADQVLGPEAFAQLAADERLEDSVDDELRARNKSSSLWEASMDYNRFMESRDSETDKFQLRLRYQVSNIHLDASPSIADGDSSPSVVLRSRRRDRMKRFLRRHLLRKGEGEVVGGPATPRTHHSVSSSETCSPASQLVKSPPAYSPGAPASGSPLVDSPEESDRRNVLRRSLGTNASAGSPEVSRKALFRSPSRSPRSRLSVPGALGETKASDDSLLKFIMEAGASMKKLSEDDPSRVANCWHEMNASKFETRCGENYKKFGTKAPSGPSIYECVACDVWQVDPKRPHIASYMQLPDLADKRPVNARHSGDHLFAPLPELLIVNMMLPDYPHSFMNKKTDGPGNSVVLFARLSKWAKENPTDPSVQLWSRFVHVHDNDSFRSRLKMITRLENPDECNLTWLESKLVAKYNGKPWMVAPQYEFHAGRGYFEIDIDAHIFSGIALSNMHLLHKINTGIVACALMVQAERDEEMPERVLVCTGLRCLNLREAPKIDLVQLGAKRLKSHQSVFIDRDGLVHHPIRLDTNHNRGAKDDEEELLTAETADQEADKAGEILRHLHPAKPEPTPAESVFFVDKPGSSYSRASILKKLLILVIKAVIALILLGAVFLLSSRGENNGFRIEKISS